MSKRKKVPEDLMETILGGRYVPLGDEGTSLESTVSQNADPSIASSAYAGGTNVSWETHPERMGIAFNLSKQVGRELDKLRLELQAEEGLRTSSSEIAEIALRIAIDDARRRGRESELLRNLLKEPIHQSVAAPDETHGVFSETTDGMGRVIQRKVEGLGYIIETTYNEQWEVLGEEVLGNVADLPVEEEYLDNEGNLVSRARDDLGNMFELVTDGNSNMLEARLLRDAD